MIVCLYAIVEKDAISVRAGLPTTADLVISTVGMLVVATAVYRALGLPLLIVGGLFILYCFFGDADWLPDAMQWKGASYGKAMWHYWMQDEGVFGVALKVSAELIFLFVLFGAILEKAGAGNYFIKIAFALLGHLRGGPAKAAVVASAMSGLYSGSSIANTVTTGTFTIPLMKRTGFSPEKAGAVEVASSTNGQLTPPVMGAAAFLIAEFTGVPYTDIIKHALVPALVSYIALVYIVHLEALKLDLKGLPRVQTGRTVAQKLIGVLTGFIFMAVLTGAVYFGLGWIKVAAPDSAFTIITAGVAVAYLWLLWIASRRPDLEVDDPNAPITELPARGRDRQDRLLLHPPHRGADLVHRGRAVVALAVGFLGDDGDDHRGTDPASIEGDHAWTRRCNRLRLRPRVPGVDRRHDLRLPQHDRNWCCYGGGGDHRRYRLADRNAPDHRRGDRVPLGRVPDHLAAAGGGHEPHPGHGPADHRQLHRGLVADGAGDRNRGSKDWAGGAPDRGTPVCVLLRDIGG